MLRHKHLAHQFVRHMPDDLSPGILYISMEYATASHLCCCGCGEEVVTPFAPAQWKMIFDGDAVSLHPSVGNWLLKCRSHYVVREGRVLEAESWSEAQVGAGIAHDRAARKAMFKTSAQSGPVPPTQLKDEIKPGPVARFLAWIRGS